MVRVMFDIYRPMTAEYAHIVTSEIVPRFVRVSYIFLKIEIHSIFSGRRNNTRRIRRAAPVKWETIPYGYRNESTTTATNPTVARPLGGPYTSGFYAGFGP